MARLRVGVLISGRGSNLQALIDAARDKSYPATIELVVANRPDAAGLRRAQTAGIATTVVDHRSFPDRAAFDRASDAKLRDAGIEFVCLAGFMRILTPEFVEEWRDRLINIHPSLLPAFRGANAHEQAIAAGVRVSGCTVHFVRPETDDGPIILQSAVPVLQDDSPSTLAARVLREEHRVYPKALRLIAQGRVHVTDGHVMIEDPVEVVSQPSAM